MAGELERMSVGSNGCTVVPSANRMRLQLDGMLEQRGAAEAFQAEIHKHHHTMTMLEEERAKLRNAHSEVRPVL